MAGTTGTVQRPLVNAAPLMKSGGQIQAHFKFEGASENDVLFKGQPVRISGDRECTDFNGTVSANETRATVTATVTNAGAEGDIVTLKVNNGTAIVNIGSYTVQNGDDANAVATGLRLAINAGTGTHGYDDGGTLADVVITAPAGTGADANENLLKVETTGDVAVSGNDVNFAGGVTALPVFSLGYAYENATSGDDVTVVLHPFYALFEPFASGGRINAGQFVTFNGVSDEQNALQVVASSSGEYASGMAFKGGNAGDQILIGLFYTPQLVA